MNGTTGEILRGDLFRTFYTTPRVGAARLSDGGGPFGFDIAVAFQVDFLIQAFGCDGIVETGCFVGDTTEFLARHYPHLPLITCDVVPEYVSFSRRRLREHRNANVLSGDSAAVLGEAVGTFDRPLVYLDAHWYERWPLHDELAAVQRGVVCIDDFDIGHPRFGFDTYAGQPCDAALVRRAAPGLDELFVGNPFADYPAPCLQVGRRSGTAYLARGLPSAALADSPMFVRVPLRPRVVPPDWAAVQAPRTPAT